MRVFADLAYDGAAFHGWQVQPHDKSVQQTIEEALARVLGKATPVTGAGRTDAGVNASRMIAHFDFDAGSMDTETLGKALDSLCGKDIAVYSLTPVSDEAHARFDACGRTYRYFVYTGKNPFFRSAALQMKAMPDFEKMNSAASRLLGIKDFTSFSKLHSSAKTNICELRECRWMKVEGIPSMWCLEISADRFLRNMVRAVAGTLLEVGRGARPEEYVSEVLEAKDRCAAGTSLPGHALYLHDIAYPEKVYTAPFRPYGLTLGSL